MGASPGSLRREHIRFGVAGVVSAAALFCVAQLFSIFYAPASAPLVALGSTIIDFTPPWLKEFVITVFGTQDKLVLFICVGIVAAVLAAGAGLLAKRSFALAVTAILILAVVIGVAVQTREATGFADLFPLTLGTICSIGALKWLTGLAYKTLSVEAESDQNAGTSRRNFLIASTLTAFGAVVAAGVSSSASVARNAAETARAALKLPSAKTKVGKVPAGAQIEVDGISKFLTPNTEFYRIDTALSVPRIDPASWSLRVHGMVEKEFTLSFEELLSKDLVETYLTLACVSNPVGGDLVGNAKWLGYPLRHLIEQAGPLDGADMVLSTSSDGFTASTPLEVLRDDRMALLAIGMNGEPLPLEHGFPARMVVPGLYGYVSATKWVVELEVTRFQDKKAYWSTRGWTEKGPIKMSSRIDIPRPSASVPAGELALGGVAWAQTRGISKVEVQIDGGEWQKAELGSDLSADTWRQWKFLWEDATPGEHVVTVRAYDAKGKLQTQKQAAVAPDGASGWHQVQFTVR